MKLSGVKIEKLLSAPDKIESNQFYLVESKDETRFYISDSKGNLILLNQDIDITGAADGHIIIYYGGEIVSTELRQEWFTMVGGETSIDLEVIPIKLISIMLNGLMQDDTFYTILDGTITFLDTIVADDIVTVHYYGAPVV